MTGRGAQLELRLPQRLTRRLIAEAQTAAPDEACGLLVGWRESDRVSATRTVQCENMAPRGTRTTRFSIDPRRLIEEERAIRGSKEEVVGFYHSHPASDPVPSLLDRTYMALWPEAVWVIVGAGSGRACPAVRAWNLDSADQELPTEVPVV